ncbi:MAG TPA: O-antigen ligase family protein [Patescibacteria group bacterium]|nr:O-antigen ligase family protein [Patescibacteria group bacterium]
MDILTVLLWITFVLLYPLGQVFAIDFPSGIRVSPLDVGMTLLTVIGYGIFFTKRKPFPRYLFPMLGFYATCILSLLVNIFVLPVHDVLIASLYFLRFVDYTSIAVVISQLSEKKKQHVPFVFFMCGILLTICGYIQYFLYPSLRNLIYDGWDQHLYRMFGTFLDPNFFGSFLVLFTLLCLYLYLEKRAYSLFYLVVAGVGSSAVFLSFSRSAYIALGTGVVVLLFLKGYRKLIGASMVILLVTGIIIVFLFAKQSEGTNLLRTASTAARFDNLFRAMAIIKDSPVFGVGFDAYRYAQLKKGFIATSGWESTHNGGGVNNSYFFVWATTGIIGLLAYLFFLRTIFVSSVKKKGIGVLVLASFAAMSVNAIFENTLFYPSIMAWLWVLAGLII